MKTNRFAAIVLAAGFSSRMESFKPLLPIGGETITDRLISTFRQNGVEVCLVVGWRQHELRAHIKTQNVRIVENSYYHLGMFTSIQAGLRCLRDGYEAFFVMPVDIPLVRPFTIWCLLEATKRHPDKLIYPVFNKIRGHPPLIPAAILPDILACQKDDGLKAVLDAHKETAVEVKVPDINITFDIDTPADYKALLERFKHYEVPTEEECEVILTDVCQVAPDIRRHCFKVADVAGVIGQALLMAGVNPDLGIIRAAAILHDIAKGQPNHAAVGAQALYKMGFGTVADIVAVHNDLPEGIRNTSLEAKVVYLADKYVKSEIVVPLEERFQSARRRFGVTPDIETRIMQRQEHAFSIKKELEVLLGCSLEAIVFR